MSSSASPATSYAHSAHAESRRQEKARTLARWCYDRGIDARILNVAPDRLRLIARQASVTPTVVALRTMATSVVDAEIARLDGRLPDLDPTHRPKRFWEVHAAEDAGRSGGGGMATTSRTDLNASAPDPAPEPAARSEGTAQPYRPGAAAAAKGCRLARRRGQRRRAQRHGRPRRRARRPALSPRGSGSCRSWGRRCRWR